MCDSGLTISNQKKQQQRHVCMYVDLSQYSTVQEGGGGYVTMRLPHVRQWPDEVQLSTSRAVPTPARYTLRQVHVSRGSFSTFFP